MGNDRPVERRRAHGGLANFALLACSCLVTVAVLEVAARIAVPQWRGLVAQNFMTATPGGVLAGVPNFDGRIASLFGEFDVPLRLHPEVTIPVKVKVVAEGSAQKVKS